MAELFLPKLDAIAIGNGPSFYDWLNSPDIPYSPAVVCENATVPLGYPKFQHHNCPKLYGAGVASQKIRGLTVYCHGDILHVDNIPEPNSFYHSGCRCYASERNIRDKEGLLSFRGDGIPGLCQNHEFSSGAMALSLASYENNHIGLIGFDGFGKDGLHPNCNVPDTYIVSLRGLIKYYQDMGRKLYSLMPVSDYNDILLHY